MAAPTHAHQAASAATEAPQDAVAADAQADLRRWVEGLEAKAPDELTASQRSHWVDAARTLAESAPAERAETLLSRAQVFARIDDQRDTAALIAYDRARLALGRGSLDRTRAVVEESLELDASTTFGPILELLLIRAARQQGAWVEALDAASSLLAREPQRVDDPDAEPAQSAIDELHRRVHGWALIERGWLEAELGRIERAAADAVQALELARATEDEVVEVDARLLLIGCSFQNHDFGAALAAAEDLVRDGLLADDAPQLGFVRGLILGEQARTDPALRAEAVAQLEAALASEALDVDLSLRATWLVGDLALASGALDDAARWTADAERLLAGFEDGTHRLRRLQVVANVAELACARGAPGDELAAIATRLDSAIDGLLESWSTALGRRRSLGILDTDERRGVVGEMIRVRARLDGDSGVRYALDRYLELQSRGTIATQRELGPLTLEDLRQALPDGGGLVIFVETVPTTHLLLVDRSSVEHFERAGSAEIQSLSRSIALQLAELPPSTVAPAQAQDFADSLAPALAELGRELFPPTVFERLSTWSAVTVVATEFLWPLPLEVVTGPDGRPLGETLPLTTVASLPLLVADWRARASAVAPTATDLTLLTHLSPGDGERARYPSLVAAPVDTRRLEAMTANYGPARRTLHIDPPATPGDLLGALESSAVVQVLAHGIQEPGREFGSAVALAPTPDRSGILWADDVTALDWRPRGLVVLASCGAALGPRRTGDDVLPHLSGSLLEIGASGVIATRAPLELDLAVELSTVFHRELTSGHSAAEALRRARAELAADGPLRALAAARVQLIGAPRNPLPPTSLGPPAQAGRVPWALSAAAAGALTLVAVLLVRRRAGGPRA